MLRLLLRPLRQGAAVLLANESTHQIAAGAAIGAVLGLVPKGNLLALTLAVLLCSLRVNRTAGLLAAGVFAWVGVAIDGFAHRLGAQLLMVESLQPTYLAIYEAPLGPWIGFHNTVVMGSLAVGLYLAYPTYLLTRLTLDRYQPSVAKWLEKRKIVRWIRGAEIASGWQAPTRMRARS